MLKEKNGIDIKLKKIDPSGNKDEFWSFEVILEYIGPRGQTGGDLPTIKLHITNDEPLLKNPQPKNLIKPYPDLTENFIILTYSIEEVIAEKLRTIIHQRCWPKHVYDTWRLLKEYWTIINIPETLDIYVRKCFYRNKSPNIPDNFDNRLFQIKNQWKEGLQRQLSNVPDFDLVYKEIKDLVNDFFSEKYKIKMGVKNMLESNYSIKYRKGDLEIEVHGDKDFVESKFKELFERKLEPVSKKAEVKIEAAVSEDKKDMSLAEFLNSKQTKGHDDKILVFGYYLEKFADESSFNVKDIEKCYQEVALPPTKNIPTYTTILIKKGYIMSVPEKKDNKKAWQLTQSGEKYVEGLPGQ